MKRIGNFLLDTACFKESILACILGKLGAEKAEWTEFKVDHSETINVFPGHVDSLFFSKCDMQKFGWMQNFVLVLKEFAPNSGRGNTTGEVITITLYKKPDKPGKGLVPVIKITYLNHSSRGLLREIQLYSQKMGSMEDFITHKNLCRQFLGSILLFLTFQPTT